MQQPAPVKMLAATNTIESGNWAIGVLAKVVKLHIRKSNRHTLWDRFS